MNYIMQEVYDNPRTTTNNHVELARRAKVSENQAKHFLKKQAVNQIDKIKKKPDESSLFHCSALLLFCRLALWLEGVCVFE